MAPSVKRGARKKEAPRRAPPKLTIAFERLLELADVGSLQLAVLTGRNVELDALALVEGLVAVHLNLREVDKQVVPILAGNEAVALLGVEPLNGTLCHDVPFFRALAGKKCACARNGNATERPRGIWYPMRRKLTRSDAKHCDKLQRSFLRAPVSRAATRAVYWSRPTDIKVRAIR